MCFGSLCCTRDRGYRLLVTWIIPVGMLVVGTDLLLKERNELISQTGDQIIAQLDELDPIAEHRVAKYLADQEVGRING